MANRFHYFSYGSNLLASRIHVMNKTATALGMGRLCNYKLVFSGWSDNWKGSPANIVPEENVRNAVTIEHCSRLPNLTMRLSSLVIRSGHDMDARQLRRSQP